MVPTATIVEFVRSKKKKVTVCTAILVVIPYNNVATINNARTVTVCVTKTMSARRGENNKAR